MPSTVVAFERLTATDLLTQVRAERAVRDTADVRILALAVEWAERHTIDPATPHAVTKSFLEDAPGAHGCDPDEHEWLGLPGLRWDTAASFAAALGLSTTAGKALIRDALVLACRMPLVWDRVLAGDVATWRARRIAQAVLGEPDDVVAYLDTDLEAHAGTIGPVLLERALDAAMLALHPEEREIAQLEALDARYARLEEHTINHTGIAHYAIRGDWADLAAFDDTVAAVAAALGATGCPESLDVRRSMAVGVLADPEATLALLKRGPAPKARRRIVLNLNLDPTHLAGLDPVVLDTHGRALLDQAVRQWCGRADMRVWVRPVRHCGGCPDCSDQQHDESTGTYTPAAHVREAIARRDRHCVFPHCTRPDERCDTDHITPFDHTDPTRGGPTSEANLALLCRHHHRLKTHAGWTYTVIEPGTYLWHDRYDQHFLRTRHGTTDLTDPPVRAPGPDQLLLSAWGPARVSGCARATRPWRPGPRPAAASP